MIRSARKRMSVLPVLVWLACACSQQPEPRPQSILVVDTDAWLVSHLVDHPEVSSDAAIDTLRVDAIDGQGHVFEVRQFTLPDTRDWPISFGVTGAVRFRLRVFRARFADVEMVRDQSVLLPPPEVTIDRLVDIAAARGGIETWSVVLRMDCLGRPVSFLQPATTCVDASRTLAAPADGLAAVASATRVQTRSGTWDGAREMPCAVDGTPDRPCIAGGFTILGDARLSGLSAWSWVDSVPFRPVLVSPFLMDRTEFTVGRFRALVEAGRWSGAPLPQQHSADGQEAFCTWLGQLDGTNDDLPLNCVSIETSMQACALDGGTVPTEAQWEHAARGRGQRRSYAWGDQDPICCAVSLSRKRDASTVSQCGGIGIEPVGSHPRSESCLGLGDESRDGLMDLSGGLAELVRDKFRSYAHACWSWQGIGTDPECNDDTASLRVSRGGSWDSGLAMALTALRAGFSPGMTTGFRCTYPGAHR